MNRTKNTLVMSVLALATACNTTPTQISYPDTAKTDTADEYFGTLVPDPYRWLENDTSAQTAQWVERQNAVSRGYLDKIPFLDKLRQRYTQLYSYERVGAMMKINGKYYFYKNDGLQNQSVLYQLDSLNAEPRVFLDPNTLSDDGTVALKGTSWSNDGRFFAYIISRSGSDWAEIYVRDLATGLPLDDHIQWAKFTGVAWHGDGFYYSAYEPATDGTEYSSKNEFHRVYFHKIGTPQSADKVEFESKTEPLLFHEAITTEDGRFLCVYQSKGHGNSILAKDLTAANPKYKTLVEGLDDECAVVGSDDEYIYVHTLAGAPKGQILAMPVKNIAPANFKTLIPEGEHVISDIRQAGDKFIVVYEVDACEQAFVFDREGKMIRQIELPDLGVVDVSCSAKHNEVFYRFSSFTNPGALYSYNIESGESTLYNQAKVAFDCDAYTTRQVTFNSKDGTLIHMFLVHRNDITPNGKNPVLLYGYGGFNISVTPGFAVSVLPFLENGGIYAVVNLRGGAEYGEEWHQAGTKMNKQNVFDDFIAAAEYLIAENYTKSSLIACRGGSNGGLLVGAVVNQRPDLFGAAVAQVGVMDMLRYHKFTIGWNWAGDYGTSDDSKEMFEYLYRYSPLHNISDDGTPYPAILVTTADHDDRVVPAHSFKYAATLQAANTGNKPKIIRIDSKAGHGSGKPISKSIDEFADIYGFIMANLGMKPKFPEN